MFLEKWGWTKRANCVIVTSLLRVSLKPMTMTMKKYEIMTITDVTAKEEGALTVSNTIKDLVSALGGKVLTSDFWGKRRFAYEVEHQTEGWYDIINFECTQDAVGKIKQKLNQLDQLVRYLLISAEEPKNGGKDGKKSK
ncbi:MAG: 30S ribosomal protein S6 [candidate division WWE3 bacterium GW2011_GWC2_44_9]|uniref:Small ribosomal subunit protein bS6 n=4 Tax=Katanobacteria TaxID=422282 RepID=A0A0G1MVP1_UNCKA|nr:MAG: 30S ribosomal protein S6 [candidate division WWE3 bacterium GW2011_GWA2_44_16]KKT84837.1 MAG: 30S ribosomal protein S6 [candidate division WWE3 bacterium GW2011_GWC2_44_9]